ncbi:MAG: DUF4907 domain-containing protein, partial [Bacteroidetes bacterium]|nr:DUF4907 domain-containing protein [Bacteroidota bacterium]
MQVVIEEKRENIPAHEAPSFSGAITSKTFEIKDSTSGKSLGWGYDICVNDQPAIHQSNIPAVQGLKYFSSEEKARITGEYAAKKMKTSGSLPTLSIKELDSLGVTK